MADMAMDQSGATQGSNLRDLSDLPGPKPLPLIGNLHQLPTSQMHRVLEGWAEVYGDMFRFHLGPLTCVAVSNPEWMQQALRARPRTYRREGAMARVIEELVGPNVFTAEGDSWKPQRKLVLEALHPRHVRMFHRTLAQVTERLLRRWRRAARTGRAIDVQGDLMRFTVDVTTTLAFGIDTNTLESTHGILQEHLSHIFPALMRRIVSPLPYWRYVKRPLDRALDAAMIELRKRIGSIISDARARLASSAELREKPTNFIEAMLMARDDEGRPFSDETVIGNCFAILAAGEDTTANTLSWMIHLLCDHPGVFRRLHEEAMQVSKDEEVITDPAKLDQLTYATAVMNEAMRLRPVAAVHTLETNHETVLGHTRLPKGTPVWLIPRVPATRVSLFEAGSGFDPDSWLEKPTPQQQAALVPFGAGVRLCPGRGLAISEVRMVTSMLAKHFRLVRVGHSDDVREAMKFTVMPTGLSIKLTERTPA